VWNKKRARQKKTSHFNALTFAGQKDGVDPNIFDFWERMHTRKKPLPKTGPMWENKGSHVRSTKYVEKFKEVCGDDIDPRSSPFDPKIDLMAGEGEEWALMDW
jgi:hypothetical protein